MAKLNITFVNEVGNNLNRYKAIDVNTGDEYLFDLSRDGTITTPGTPLNAERLNAIVEAINSMDTEKQSQIDTLKNKTDKLREDFDNSFTEKSVTRKIRKLVDYPSKEISYPDQNVTLKQLGGMSYKYNQLATSINATFTQDGVTVTNNNDGSITLNGTNTSETDTRDYPIIYGDKIHYTSGHKYLLGSSSGYDSSKIEYFITNMSSYVVVQGLGIIQASQTTTGGFTLRIKQGATFNNVKIRPIVVDLTAMYGVGNEPTTVEHFLADYPMYNDYVEYTEGDIINAAVSSVDSVGANIWDEEWEVGRFLWETGEYYNDNASIRSKNYIRILPNTSYYCNQNVFMWDSDYNYIGYNTEIETKTFTTPANAYWFKLATGGDYGTTYNNDICINVSNDSFNGTYLPYIHDNYPIPSSIQALEGYGWGINDSCYNYVDFDNKKFVKKVGRVDLGTLDWAYSNLEGHKYFYANIVDIVVGQSTGIPNIICSKYVADTDDNVYKNINDKTISIMNTQQRIFIYDSAYTDTATFKAAMSGVYLYYELATPVETDIVALNNYPVWQYGTETQNAIMPAIMIKEYSISTLDQIVKNIEVDANQTDMIEKLVEKDLAIDNSIKNITTQQTNHSSAISDLSDRVVDLEFYKIDKSKLTIEQNLVNTILKYNNVEIDRIENLDVAYLPNIVFDVYQDSQFTAQEKVTITNSTDIDMYVSIKGLKEHNNLFVPFGESVTSQLEISDFSGFPDSYIATIEIKIYYNPKTNYNATTGYTVFENVKTINLRATVHPTDR